MLYRQAGRSLIVDAPAKLNLFLEVLGKRADGYHELETLMVSIGLYDTLSFTEDSSQTIELRCVDAGARIGVGAAQAGVLPDGRNNLVVQAAYLLRDWAGVQRGARIDLFKRIPVAAGLAGGSSDAAATLVALSRLWGLKPGADELARLASQLGSDIGFFLARSPAAICRGRGEQVQPLDLAASLHFVVCRPATGLSTALVYRHCRPVDKSERVGPLVDALQNGCLARAARLLRNSLQSPAEELNTEVRHLRSFFSRQPVLGHMMSGSGTAYFGLCATRRQAQLVAARARAAGLGRVFVVQSRP